MVERIRIPETAPSGSRILKDFAGKPNDRGVLAEFLLDLPSYKRGIYYASAWWPGGGNRMQPCAFATVDSLFAGEGGFFLLLDLGKHRCLAVLPLAGGAAYAWLEPRHGRFWLKLGTHGTEKISGHAPLVAWATSTDPYAACRIVWEHAARVEPTQHAVLLRHAKPYPQMFDYLGWCSWEDFKQDIDEQKLAQAIRCINDGPVPIRFVVIDDGHQMMDNSSYFHRKLVSFMPNPEKFPKAYQRLAALRDPGGVRWLGIWLPMLGGMAGIAPRSELARFFEADLVPVQEGGLLPQNNEAAMGRFMNAMIGNVAKAGFDFVKVDFMNLPIMYYAGAADPSENPQSAVNAHQNPYQASANLCRALEKAAADHGLELLLCNTHNASCLFHLRRSNVVRCSEDYRAEDVRRARDHVFEGFHAIPWLGQIGWADHDMFHSRDRVAGRLMAVAKAVAGGPVYLSDDPKDFAPEVISPLCYDDGLLLRPLAPAAPLPQDIFTGRREFFRVVAPLANDCAAVVAFHLDRAAEPGEEISCGCEITPSDYSQSTIMMQPSPGPCPIPEDGLLVYDWDKRTASRMRDGYQLQIKGFGHRLLIICPIRDGWALIGRIDKYLSPAATEIIEIGSDRLSFLCRESGPVAIWSDSRPVRAKDLQVKTSSDGLNQIMLAPGRGKQLLTVTR